MSEFQDLLGSLADLQASRDQQRCRFSRQTDCTIPDCIDGLGIVSATYQCMNSSEFDFRVWWLYNPSFIFWCTARGVAISLSPSARIDRRLFLQSTAAGIGASLCGAADATSPTKEQEIFFRSARTLRDMMKAREVSPLEVIKTHLERIDIVEPHINAVNFFPRKPAIEEAEVAERRIQSGNVDWESTPPLGVRVSIKDMYQVADMPTTAGARFREENYSEEDATIVRKLRQAGAIVVAITNTPLNHSALETSNKLHGQTNNPYNLDRTPGGSSGGEAALIAAGGSPWGLGGDSGGSIRLPAHFCGIAGLVPSWGRFSTAGNVPSIYNSGPFYLRCGPMARYVEDLALMLPIICGLDPRDPFTFPLKLRDHKLVQIDKLKVAYCTDALNIKPSDDIQASIQQAADVMRVNGANVTLVYPPNFDAEPSSVLVLGGVL